VWNDIARQRITRRRLIQGAGGAALGAASIYAVGCGGGGGDDNNATPGDAPPEGTPRLGGILHSRQQTGYPNFNPFGPGIAALVQGLFVGFTFYDHLWYVPTDTGETIPFLGTEFEVSEDGTQITVTMGDAVFHDIPPVSGRPVRAGDVKASYERFKEQIPFGFSWLQQILESIEAPDDHTVVFHQNRTWAWFFTSSNAGSPWTSSIVPEEIVGDDDMLNSTPIGSGRWTLAGHDGGTNVRLRKFPNWREPGRPYLDGVDFIYLPEDTLAIANFKAKEIDSIGGLNNVERDDIENSFGDQVVTSSDLGREYRCLMLKNEPPFDDPDVRRGINLALNRDELRQVLNLGDGELCGPLPPAHVKYVLPEDDPDLMEYFRFDPQESKEVLDAAGFPFDQEFTLKYSNFGDAPDLAEVVAAQLRAVGININLPGAEDITAWLSNTLGPGNFQMTSFTHLPYEDPSLPLNFYIEPNQMGYSDPEVQSAFDAAAETLEEAARIEATYEAQRVLIRKYAPMLNLFSPVTHGARWDYYKGTVEGRGSFGLFNSGAWLDK
jgi:peptide/nickel transport system substrate-binding protein